VVIVRDVSEADTVRHFEFNGLVHRFFNVFIVTESLPLSVDRVDRSSREDASLDELVPVDWVFCPFLWVLSNDVINLDDLSDGELCAAE
jgi:hypothetical protein